MIANRKTAWLLLSALVMAFAYGCSKSESGSAPGGAKGNSDSQSSKTQGSDQGAKKTDADSVKMDGEQQKLAGVKVVLVEPRVTARSITVPGQIMLNEQRTAHVGSYADGRVTRVLAAAGDIVRQGAPLAYLHSHSVHETAGALAQGFAERDRQRAAVAYAETRRDRYAHLYSIQAAPLEESQRSQQEVVQAQTALASAEATVHMEQEHLGELLGVAPESLTPATLYAEDEVPIKTPIAGTVITRSVTPGTVLEPGVEAFTVSNLGSVWMVASVNEADLSRMHLGEKVEVHSQAWPGVTFAGKVTLIGSMLDANTRTIQVRATLENPLNRLKPAMFATAEIDEPATRRAIIIGEDAVQQVNGASVVFVTQDGTTFVPRTVKTGPPANHEVEVLDGLHAGEHIAWAGTFMLKSDLLKGTIGEE